MQTSYLRGVLFCLVATVSWGCMFPVMTSALTQMDPFNFTVIRYTIAAIPFAVLLLAREGKGAFNLKGERHLLAWLFGTTGPALIFSFSWDSSWPARQAPSARRS